MAARSAAFSSVKRSMLTTCVLRVRERCSVPAAAASGASGVQVPLPLRLRAEFGSAWPFLDPGAITRTDRLLATWPS